MVFLEWEAPGRLCHGGDQAGATVLSMQAPKAGNISKSGHHSIFSGGWVWFGCTPQLCMTATLPLSSIRGLDRNFGMWICDLKYL